MKKVIYAIIGCCLAAWTTTHENTRSLNVNELHIREKPLQVQVIPGEKIYGTAECVYLFGIPIWAPSHRAYGAELDISSGNFAPDRCTKGAFYQAVVSSNADVIISPQYRTDGTGFLCLPWIGCLYENTEVTVSGYKGTYQFTPGTTAMPVTSTNSMNIPNISGGLPNVGNVTYHNLMP